VPMTGGRYGHARVAILSVIEEETQAVHKVLGLTRRIEGRPYFVAPGTDTARPDMITREVGRTNIQSGECIRDVIEHWQAEVLILCGIAGGIAGHETVELGDIVIPNYIHYCSFSKLSESGEQRRYIAYDHPSLWLHSNYAAPLRDDSSWITNKVRQLMPDNRTPRVLIGSLVAGDKVYGNPDSEEQAKIVAEFDEAIAIDMESVGLCRAVAASRINPQYNPRLLIVRGISDLVGATANSEQRAEHKVMSAVVAATFTRRVVRDILANEPDPRMPAEASHGR
jgi:nucleoside phosphorylase